MNYLFHLFFSVSIVLFSGCNSDSVKTESKTENKETNETPKLTDFESPCELLLEKDVRSVLNLKAELAIKNDDKMYTHRTCKYQWEDGSMIKSQVVGTQTVSYEIPSQIMVVVARDATEANYETVTKKVYKNPEDISGIGERARWGDNMNQLSFLKNGLFFHVHVMVSQDNAVNREKAIELAKIIDSRI